VLASTPDFNEEVGHFFVRKKEEMLMQNRKEEENTNAEQEARKKGSQEKMQRRTRAKVYLIALSLLSSRYLSISSVNLRASVSLA